MVSSVGPRCRHDTVGSIRTSVRLRVVHVYVSQLRKVLRAGCESDGIETALVTRAPGYMLEVERGRLDADRFERLVEEGRAELASGRTWLAGPLLLEALAEWRGPALADFVLDSFAQNEIARLEEARVSALEERIEADLALGRHTELVGELESLVAAHPLASGCEASSCLPSIARDGRQRRSRPTRPLDVFSTRSSVWSQARRCSSWRRQSSSRILRSSRHPCLSKRRRPTSGWSTAWTALSRGSTPRQTASSREFRLATARRRSPLGWARSGS